MTVNKWQKNDITILYSAKWPKKMTAEWHSTKLYWQNDNRLMTFSRMTSKQNNTQLTFNKKHLNCNFNECHYPEWPVAEQHLAKCHYNAWHSAERHYDAWHSAECFPARWESFWQCHYPEWHLVECNSAEPYTTDWQVLYCWVSFLWMSWPQPCALFGLAFKVKKSKGWWHRHLELPDDANFFLKWKL